MNKIKAFEQFLYSFDCPSDIVEESAVFIKNTGFTPINNNSRTTIPDIKNTQEILILKNWIQECLDAVTVQQLPETKLKISQMWGCKSEIREYHHTHKHPNSIISGVIYLTDSEAETWFSIPSLWGMSDAFFVRNQADTLVFHKEKTEKGKLVLFPSSLVHSVSPHTEKFARYCIAFNSFFDGGIGDLDSLTNVNINLKD